MKEIYYKIGEVSEILKIEPYTLRYLESSLKLKIKRDERGERLYTDADLDTLRLILQLKNEKGLNTTAIKLALDNLNESGQKDNQVPQVYSAADFVEIVDVTRNILQQNEEILEQNRVMQQKLDALEKSQRTMDKQNSARWDELLEVLRAETNDKRSGWLAKLMRTKS
ncbi:MAG TPA: MerR family transcriptional regulator [Syntrophomonas sp.]|nr:MerR family transcriptional regulator [Syntrophomonas sp.]HRW13016.1 MerR family transcriptional regulator [Syntrophomonas sp.]